jgi:3-oxoacyl-[acyl-carrier-protein] synthase III
MSIRILGTGSFLPPRAVSNRDLYPMIKGWDAEKASASLTKKGVNIAGLDNAGIFDQWVQQVCGIQSRYMADDDLRESEFGATESMAAEAGRNAITDAGVTPEDIDTVILTSFTPHMLIPNASVILSHLLGVTNSGGFILNTACSGFLDGVIAAYCKIKAGLSKTALVASSECITREIDYNDPTTAILFGDGAAAAVISDDPDTDGGILAVYSAQEYSAEHIRMKNGGIIEMGGGPAVQRRAVNAMYTALDEAVKNCKLSMTDLDVVIPHQANLRIIRGLQKKIGCDDDQVAVSIANIGNISCATIPITLDMVRHGKLPVRYQEGKTLAGITSVGGGDTYAGIVSYI